VRGIFAPNCLLARCEQSATDNPITGKVIIPSHFNFTEDKTGWEGTKVAFEISRKSDQTKIHFTHEGLVPAYECFNVCSDAGGHTFAAA
jgi:regulatory protein YycH of two-component signal transduction system YycFG